jgi:hypothetical protein
MIVVKIQGGLGNQLFQYSLALALKKKNPDVSVLIDKSFYKTSTDFITPRRFSLDVFNIEIFNEPTIIDLTMDKLKSIFSSSGGKKNIFETSKLYNPDILEINKAAYLNGYWQSYRYFDEVKNELKKQLTLKKTLTPKALEDKKNILSQNVSVSVHIRKSDYVSEYSDIYTQLNLDYYNSALSHIKTKVGDKNISVFVFSDDIEWCKLNLNYLKGVYFIDNLNKPEQEDMMLMSYCHHNIIANSSYSWWGAWLNNSVDKIVIAPSKWHVSQETNFTNSIYPPSWTII